MSRRLAWALVLREVAEVLRFNGPIVSDLVTMYGGELAKLTAEDGQDVAEVLQALARLLQTDAAVQEAPEGPETP